MRAERLRRRATLAIWGCALLIVTAVVAAVLMQVERRRTEVLQNASLTTEQMVAGAEVALNRTFLGLDALLAGLPLQVAPAIGAGGAFDAALAQRLLAAAADRNLMLRDVALVSGDGHVLATARSGSAAIGQSVDAAMRSRALSSRPATLGISAPVTYSASSERVLVLLRAVKLGQESALAIALVPISQLGAVLSPAGEAAGPSMTLERDDGVLLASAPLMEGLSGRRLQAGALPFDALTGRAAEASGRIRAEPSLVAARPLLYPALSVSAAIALDRVLAPWRDDRRMLLTMTVVLVALVLAAAAATHWQFARQLRARADAARAKATLDRALGALSDGFLLCDAQDRIVAWNERYVDLHPWLKPVLDVGTPFERLASVASHTVHPGAAAQAERAAWRDTRVARHRRADSEFEHALATGDVIHVVERRTPDGGVVSIFRDVTRAEREMRAAKAAAESASEAKTRFLAAMSHEIRTPLNGVLGMNSLLLGTALSAEQRGYAHTVESSGRTLLALIDDILDLSRIEAGRMDLESIDFDVRALVDEVVGTLRPRADDKGLLLRTHVPETTLRRLRGDGNRLRQVLYNLIGNAVKFTERGHVDVSIMTGELAGQRLGLRVVVRDTGVGIPPDAMPRLFERFAQADGSMARRYGGSGLGLAISREIVDLMGGQIAVDSTPGQGSSFTVTIAFERGADTAPAPAPAAVAAVPSMRILVAEDNEVNQLVIRATLERMGHRCDIVSDGMAAVGRAASGPWDCILMDIQMPGMDGEAAARAIRALPGAMGAVPIIALTANAMLEDRTRYLAGGMNDFVSKPIDAQGLARALAGCLRQAPATADACADVA